MGIELHRRQTMPPSRRRYAPVGAFPDAERGILHSGTASAVTRSLIYRCRDTGPATSTGIPSSASSSDFRATMSRRLRSGSKSIKRSRSLSASPRATEPKIRMLYAPWRAVLSQIRPRSALTRSKISAPFSHRGVWGTLKSTIQSISCLVPDGRALFRVLQTTYSSCPWRDARYILLLGGIY